MACEKFIMLFFFILSYLFLNVESFMPTGRQSHSTVLVKDKIYFFGGVMDDIECSNEVFYLDLSQQINSEFPPWTDLTLNSGLDFKSCWTTAVLNDDTIYLIGGIIEYQNNDSFTSLVHAFNPNLGQWNIPAIQGKAPERRRNVQAVADGTGNIYVFGGKFDELLGSKFTQFFNDMIILNANDLTWSYGSNVNAPMKRDLYTASLLSDGTIVYIGGREQNADYTLREVDINQINLYDTNLASWSIVQAISNDVVIDSRYLHSAVLVSDGRIIVYGGARNAAQSRYDKVFPDLVVLNTQTFEWTVPEVSSNIDEVPSLTAHTANLFENYMIVAFGNITRTNSFPSAVHNSKIYLLDVNNYTWVNGFASSASTSENQTGKMKIMIGTISGILGVIIFTAIGIFGYKMYQKRKLRDAESNTKVIS